MSPVAIRRKLTPIIELESKATGRSRSATVSDYLEFGFGRASDAVAPKVIAYLKTFGRTSTSDLNKTIRPGYLYLDAGHFEDMLFAMRDVGFVQGFNDDGEMCWEYAQ